MMGDEDQPSHSGMPALATTTPNTNAKGIAGINSGRAPKAPLITGDDRSVLMVSDRQHAVITGWVLIREAKSASWVSYLGEASKTVRSSYDGTDGVSPRVEHCSG